jgi:hypothetical protein
VPVLDFYTKKSSTGTESKLNYKDKSFDGSYNKTDVALVFGFGADIDVSENIFITAGVRLGYGLTDVTTEYSDANKFKSEDVKGDQISPLNGWAHYEDASTTGSVNNPNAFNYEKTNRAFAGLHLGVSYKFTK